MSEPSQPTVLHYTGAAHDRGGVMSILRALGAGAPFACVLGVSAGFGSARLALPKVEFAPVDPERIDLRNAIRTRRVAHAIAAWLAQDARRIVHVHSRTGLLVALWLARWGERRVVASVHCYGRQRWFYRCAARRLGGRLYWLSPAMKRYYGVAAADGWAQCIPGCVSDPKAPPARRARDPGALRLGGVGALVRWKGWHLVPEALAALPPAVRARVRFTHIGTHDGTREGVAYAEELRAATARHGLGEVIEWRGEQRSSSALLAEIDCLAIASDREPFSIAMLEALAAGVPVLAADSGGATDIVEPGRNGWLFARERPGALSAALAALLDAEAWRSIAIRPEDVQPYSASRIAARWLEVYRALLARDGEQRGA